MGIAFNMLLVCLSAWGANGTVFSSFLRPPVCKLHKVWLFALNDNIFQQFPGQSTGVSDGLAFEKKLIEEVCALALKKCDTVLLPYSFCQTTMDNLFTPGEAINQQYVDACVRKAITPERLNSVAFTLPYRRATGAFYVLQGNPKGFDPNNLQFAKIAILSGTFTNGACLNRNDVVNVRLTHVSNVAEAVLLLEQNRVDAILSPTITVTGLDQLPFVQNCGNAGALYGGFMARKDGIELLAWWNAAFKKYVQRGLYDTLCQEMEVSGNDPRCISNIGQVLKKMMKTMKRTKKAHKGYF